MKRIPREKAYNYYFDADLPPAIRVSIGETFEVETEDASSGTLREEGRLPTDENNPGYKYEPGRGNPVGGPIFVEGVEKGDLLVVEVLEIIPDEQGTTWIRDTGGPLADSYEWHEATTLFQNSIKHIPGPSGTTRDGRAVVNDRMSWDLQPHIGTISTAPECERISSVVGQGPWGGNMDINDFREGSKIYLNSYHEGGLLFVGDVHGCESDTEFYGVADETRAVVKLKCDVVKGKTISPLRMETEDRIIAVHSGKPLEGVVKTCMVGLMDWMVNDYGISRRDAYVHAGINPNVKVHVYQMVDMGRLGYTAGVSIKKDCL